MPPNGPGHRSVSAPMARHTPAGPAPRRIFSHCGVATGNGQAAPVSYTQRPTSRWNAHREPPYGSQLRSAFPLSFKGERVVDKTFGAKSP